MAALVDVGSTWAKLTVVDERGAVIRRARIPTSQPGLVAELHSHADTLDHACSSAGGGLRIAVVGLESRLTVEAARRVAHGSGGRVVATIAGAIDRDLGASLTDAAPDLVLLTGGTDGGERKNVIENAHALRRLQLGAAVVIAANADAADEASRALAGAPLVRVVANVLPRIGLLAAAPANAAIRSLFADHVIRVGRFPDAASLEPIIRMPTPAAVLSATELLSTLLGTSVVVCDVGGATTDVHSAMCEGRPGPVPAERMTRTVEGDLGLRSSAAALVEASIDAGLVAAEDEERLVVAAARRVAEPADVSTDSTERRLDAELAGLAITIALERHAGQLAVTLEEGGASLRPTGRDLRSAVVFVATGGIFEHAEDPVAIAAGAWQRGRDRNALLATNPRVRVDSQYVVAAAGLLAAAGDRARAARLLQLELALDVMTCA